MSIQPIQKVVSNAAAPIAKTLAPSGGNFVFRIQELVNRILTQFSRFSELSRASSEKLKRDYQLNTEGAAKLQEKSGSVEAFFSGAALVASGLSAGLSKTFTDQSPAWHKIAMEISGLAGQTIPIAGGFHMHYNIQPELMRKQFASSMEQAEVNNKAQEHGDGNNAMQSFMELVNSCRETFKRASG